jgi:acyl carrier protein
MREILSSIYKIIAKELQSCQSQIASNRLELINDLGLTEWQILILLNQTEAYFNISIPDEETVNITTIKNLAHAVHSQMLLPSLHPELALSIYSPKPLNVY